jgi:hypothetical protein
MRLERHWVWRSVGSVLRTNAAVTEKNSLGFEDFRKRTNEIRSADAGVCTKYKIMTL